MAGTQVPAEAVVLQVLDQDAAVPVDDRLRQAGRARREEDVQGVRERQGVELERPRLGEQLLPADGVREHVVRPADVGHVDEGLEGRQPLADRRHLLAAVDELVAEAVAGHGQEHLRLELPQAVEDAAHAELGRAGGPDRAQAGGGEEGDDRLRDVREVRDDAVAGPDAEALEPCPRPGDLVAELAEGQVERLARLRAGEDRDGVQVLVAPHHVRRVVEAGAWEPLRAGHVPGAEHALVGSVRPDPVELPDRRPEALEVGHRPLPELLVLAEVEPSLGPQPGEVAPEVGLPPGLVGRRPEDLPGLDHRPLSLGATRAVPSARSPACPA